MADKFSKKQQIFGLKGVCGNLICGRKNAVATVRNNLVALQELLKKRVFKAGPALDGTECPQGNAKDLLLIICPQNEEQ